MNGPHSFFKISKKMTSNSEFKIKKFEYINPVQLYFDSYILNFILIILIRTIVHVVK
jgi:hypothetical protein